MKLTAYLILLVSTFLVACSSESSVLTTLAVQQQELQKEWRLVSINNKTVTATSYLKVDKQTKASGKLACNNFFGTAILQANRLRIDKMATTRKQCGPDISSVEMMVSNTLSNWSEIQISAKKLILTGEKHKLVYTPK